MSIQILVTTMQKKDLSLVQEMNITSDVFIANQSDTYDYISLDKEGYRIEMLTTKTLGLSRNRNIALTNSKQDAEYLLFMDDDAVFSDGYEKMVENEFLEHPEAEAIKFRLRNIDSVRPLSMPLVNSFHKASIRNITASGVCGLAVKRTVLLKKNLHFNEYFGPGTVNYCGEDTIFLQDMLKKNVRLYLSPVIIAGIDQTESSWYEGHNRKYFVVKGKVLADIFPRLSYFLAVRSSYRFSKRKTCQLGFYEILKYYWCGIREYLNGKT